VFHSLSGCGRRNPRASDGISDGITCRSSRSNARIAPGFSTTPLRSSLIGRERNGSSPEVRQDQGGIEDRGRAPGRAPYSFYSRKSNSSLRRQGLSIARCKHQALELFQIPFQRLIAHIDLTMCRSGNSIPGKLAVVAMGSELGCPAAGLGSHFLLGSVTTKDCRDR